MSFFRSPNVKVVRIRTSYSKLRHSGNRRNHGTVLNKSLLPKSAFAIFRHSGESRSPYLPSRLDTGLRHSGMTDGAKDNCDTVCKPEYDRKKRLWGRSQFVNLRLIRFSNFSPHQIS